MFTPQKAPTYTTTWIIWYTITIHLIWGVALLYSPVPANITGLHALVGQSSLRVLVGCGLLLVGGMAICGLTFQRRQPYLSVLLLMPQQFLLMLSAGEALKAMIRGATADGVVRPQVFLVAGLAPIVLMSVFHSLAVLDHTGVLHSRFWRSLARLEKSKS